MFVPDDIEILLCTEAIDMRKGADGLAGLVCPSDLLRGSGSNVNLIS